MTDKLAIIALLISKTLIIIYMSAFLFTSQPSYILLFYLIWKNFLLMKEFIGLYFSLIIKLNHNADEVNERILDFFIHLTS
ncbi:hypothetical protein Cyrtocomes_00620 [Candidatus Cyrtobacter comes]|uniref:Uncharacterized protein n=1 Tax=Candidatus Cyrtobacter comes TaxID=675776 RepID=A0ABU5L8K3_9RICK|nr:hypothetical protein [Candidatus Cyrtobacter comes]